MHVNVLCNYIKCKGFTRIFLHIISRFYSHNFSVIPDCLCGTFRERVVWLSQNFGVHHAWTKLNHKHGTAPSGLVHAPAAPDLRVQGTGVLSHSLPLLVQLLRLPWLPLLTVSCSKWDIILAWGSRWSVFGMPSSSAALQLAVKFSLMSFLLVRLQSSGYRW